MADEEEKKSLVQRLTQDKAGLKLSAIAFGIGACVVGYGFFVHPSQKSIPQSADEQSATRKVASIKDGGGVKSAMTPEDARISHEQTALDIQRAIKTGGSETPPVLPPVDEQQALPSHLPVDKDETPAAAANKKSTPDFPMPDETPATKSAPPAEHQATHVANVVQRQPINAELLKAYQTEEGLLSKTKVPSIATVAYEDLREGSGGSKSGNGEGRSSGSGGGGIGDGHYLEENGRWHDAQTKSLWHAGGASASEGKGKSSSDQSNEESDSGPKFTVPAPGTLLYAVLLGKVNSDAPGDVIAEIRQGAYTGARLLGSFNYTRVGVMITFKSMTFSYTDEDGVKKPKTLSIDAVSLNEKDLSPAMASSIDRHLIESFAVNFAAGFLQGIGQAAASSGSSASYGVGGSVFSNAKMSTTNEMLYGFGQGANQMSSAFQSKFGSLRDTITVKAQTPFALLFRAGTGG